MLEIRKAESTDVDILYNMIQQVADFFHRSHEITVTPEKLLKDGFSSHPKFESYLLMQDNECIGFTLYSHLYSCWQGERTLYVEDLFILPEYRQKGYGTLLFRKIAEIAVGEGIKVAWEVDREDLKQRHFFSDLGAIDRPQKMGFYLNREDLKILATGMDILDEDR